MKSLKRLWMPVLLGVLLMIMLVGAANARPNARPLEQAWRVLTVPASYCIPRRDLEPWTHESAYVGCRTGGGCMFVCPVNFPAAGEQAVGAVNVKRFTMYAYDNEYVVMASAYLLKTYPPGGGALGMASGDTSKMAADPQSVLDTTIINNPVYRTQGPYISLFIGDVNIKVYGFFIHYTW